LRLRILAATAFARQLQPPLMPTSLQPSEDPPLFEYRSEMPASQSDLSLWHHRPGALQRLKAPWENLEIVKAAAVENGAQAKIRLRLLPGVWREWIAEHRNVQQDGSFTDVQISGPFANWEHHHLFQPNPQNEQSSLLEDRIHCQLPGGPLTTRPAKPYLRRRLERLFRYRHAVTRDDLQRWREFPASKPLHILVSGATGFIGTSLVALLHQAGHKVTKLSRRPAEDTLVWNPAKGELDLGSLPHIDAVIHLAGENVAGGRWTAERKKRILESRTVPTQLLTSTIAALPNPPQVFVSASGASCYPANGQAHDESTPIDDSSFLGNVVKEWEAAAKPAHEAGIRVVHLRIPVVLSPDGGALAKLLPIFRAGLGGPIGAGKFGFSWIALDDVIDLFHRAVVDNSMHGAYNAAAPGTVDNRTFTRLLARTIRRPAILPVPPFVLRILFGEMATETVMADLRVHSSRLKEINHRFRLPELENTLAHVLGR